MALDKPVINIPLGTGLMSEVAAKLIEAGSLLSLINCQHDHTGSVVKRPGGVAMSDSVFNAANAAAPWALGTKGGELVRLSRPGNTPMYAYSPTQAKWNGTDSGSTGPYSLMRGPWSMTSMTVSFPGGTGQGCSIPDMGYGSGYGVVTYERSDSVIGTTVESVVIDYANGGNVIARHQTTFNATRPRAIAVGTYLCVVYSTGTNVECARWDTSSFNGSPTVFVVDNVGLDGGPIDLLARDATTFHVAYQRTGSLILKAAIVTPSTSSSSVYKIQRAASTDIVPSLGFAWVQDAGFGAANRLAIVTCDTVNGLHMHWNIPAPTAGVAIAATDYTLDATETTDTSISANPGCQNIVAWTEDSDTSGHFMVLYEDTRFIDDTQGSVKYAKRAAVITTGTMYRGVGLRSKALKYNSDIYVAVCTSNDNTTDSNAMQAVYLNHVRINATGFLYQAPIATAMVGNGTGFTEKRYSQTAVIAGPTVNGSSTFLFASPIRTMFPFPGANPTFSDRGIATVTINTNDAAASRLGRPVEVNDAVLVPGGTLSMYDGVEYAELGFATNPPPLALTLNVAAGLSVATYYYIACYARTDATGRRHRSGLSVALPITTDGGHHAVDVIVETLRESGHKSLDIEVYRAKDTPDLFTLVKTVANTTAANTVTFLDQLSDGSAAGTEPAYNTGGILENNPIPGAKDVALFQDRIWFIPNDDPSRLLFSSVLSAVHGPTFNDVLALEIRDERGDPTAIAAKEDKLYVFKKDAIYVIYGRGPDATGAGGNYAYQLVAEGLGTEEVSSVVVTDDGVLFKSSSARAGWHAIRGLEVQYFGQGVRDFNSYTVSAAVEDRVNDQVRWYTTLGTTLVWESTTKTWASWSGQDACAAALWNDSMVYARTTTAGSNASKLVLETPGTYQEAGVNYFMAVMTPWLSLAGLHGFQRIYRSQIIGSVISTCDVSIYMYRDHDDSSIVGSATASGLTSTGSLKFEYRPDVPKLSSIKFLIAESAATSNAAIELVSLALQVGIKPGLRKLSPSQRYS